MLYLVSLSRLEIGDRQLAGSSNSLERVYERRIMEGVSQYQYAVGIIESGPKLDPKIADNRVVGCGSLSGSG